MITKNLLDAGISDGELYRLLIAVVATRQVVSQHQLKATEFRVLVAERHREGGGERALWIAGGSTSLALATLLLLGVFPLIPHGIAYVLGTTGACSAGVGVYEEFDQSAHRTAENCMPNRLARLNRIIVVLPRMAC